MVTVLYLVRHAQSWNNVMHKSLIPVWYDDPGSCRATVHNTSRYWR